MITQQTVSVYKRRQQFAHLSTELNYLLTFLLSLRAPSPPLFPGFLPPIDFFKLFDTDVCEALGEDVLSSFSALSNVFSFSTSLVLTSRNPFELCEATGDEGKPFSKAVLLATSFVRICLYNSAALDVYFASILPPSVQPCCLKKICARLFPPKLIIFSCSGVHESKFVDLHNKRHICINLFCLISSILSIPLLKITKHRKKMHTN